MPRIVTHHRSPCVTLAAFVVGVFFFAAPLQASAERKPFPEGQAPVAVEGDQPPKTSPARAPEGQVRVVQEADAPRRAPASLPKADFDGEPPTDGAVDPPPTVPERARGQEVVERTPSKPARNQLVSEQLLEPGATGETERTGQGQDQSAPRKDPQARCDHCARRVSLVIGINAGFGLPTKHSELESNTQRVVSGLSFGPPGMFLSAAIPLRGRWDLVPRFAAQIVWGGNEVKLAPSVELRARVFPGAPNRRWEEFFVFGVGYGELHHIVHAEELVGPNLGLVQDLQSAAAGPFRILGAMGARWNSKGRLAVDVEVTPYILFPNWSVHVELSAGLVIKL